MKDIENLDVLFVLVRMEDRIYLIGRGRLEEVNVSEIASEFGGGGHPTAASATVKGMALIEAHERLIKTLKEMVRPKKVARDAMVYPVKTIEPERTLEEAGEILTRYNLNILPVLKNERVIGLISKQVVEKAECHGLKSSLVKEYMTTEFSVASPDNDLRHAWDERGAQALEALAIHAPDKFVAVVAQLRSRPEAQDAAATDPAHEHRGLQEISERTRYLLARVAEGDDTGPGAA